MRFYKKTGIPVFRSQSRSQCRPLLGGYAIPNVRIIRFMSHIARVTLWIKETLNFLIVFYLKFIFQESKDPICFYWLFRDRFYWFDQFFSSVRLNSGLLSSSWYLSGSLPGKQFNSFIRKEISCTIRNILYTLICKRIREWIIYLIIQMLRSLKKT